MLLLAYSSGVKATTLWCSGCDRWLPDEKFHRTKRLTQRRGRARRCRECWGAWFHQPGACAECGEPTTSRYARFCRVHHTEHRRGVSRDFYFDRFGHTGQWNRKSIVREIRRFARERGYPPRQSDWAKGRVGRVAFGERARRTWPPVKAVQLHFGSWDAAIEAAGFEPRGRGGGKPQEKTCRSGRHLWVPSNILVTSSGVRRCRACRRESNTRYMRNRRKRLREQGN